ncbi:MAG: hypothetical protein ACR2RV_13215 [Verrucomicrobiales bacterium]
MNLLYPRFRKGSFSGLLKTAVIGALIAGVYGIAHDQITYAISPEYFTCFKFRQFSYADPGLGDRSFVIVIGFLATWWVGFFSGWFLWRLGVDKDGVPPRPMAICRLFLMIIACGFAFGIAGYFYGRHKVTAGDLDDWLPYTESIGVSDPAAFMTVGQIHNFGYLGALVGLVAAGIAVRRDRGKGGQR